MFRDELSAAAKIFSLEPNERQSAQFDRFYRLMLEWNEKINLTAITEPREFAIKHIVDSLSLVRTELELDGRRVIDVGTGAGFPGIPLKIFCPSIRLTLLDSLNKRINFLRTAVEALELEGVECIHARAEDAARSKLRESFDLAVSRAVAKLNVLAEYCLPFVSSGGSFVAYKGGSIENEFEEARAAIKVLGGSPLDPIEFELPDGSSRSLIVIEKIDRTPKKFPRKAGSIEKNPLSDPKNNPRGDCDRKDRSDAEKIPEEGGLDRKKSVERSKKIIRAERR